MEGFQILDTQATAAWIRDNEEGMVRVFERHHPFSTVRRYRSLKKFLGRHPRTGFIRSYLLFELVVDPLTEQFKGKDYPKRLRAMREILDVYLEFDSRFGGLAPHPNPHNDPSEQKARWRQIKAAFKKLSKKDQWDLFEYAVSKSIRLGRQNHWILEGLSPNNSRAGLDLFRSFAMVAAHRAVAKALG